MKNFIKIIFPFIFQSEKILFWQKMSNNLFIRGFKRCAFFIEGWIMSNYGCAISCQANLSKNIKFPHPIGIVIGAGVTLGERVVIYQNVTIGRKSMDIDGYPIIENDVVIYCNAVVIGDITVAEKTIVGAGSFLAKSTNNSQVFIS